jgi:hypothetical protein
LSFRVHLKNQYLATGRRDNVSEKEVREVLEDIRNVTDAKLDRTRQLLEKEGLHKASVDLTESYRYNLCRRVDEQTETATLVPLASSSADSKPKSE